MNDFLYYIIPQTKQSDFHTLSMKTVKPLRPLKGS